MIQINEHFLKLQKNYLFSTIANKITAFQEKCPDKKIIKLGIGDVTRPLVPCVIEAMHQAVEEMANQETFRGYGPEQGYEFLRKQIQKVDYEARGISIDLDEIFISDGAKCDTGNIGDILSNENIVAIPDPVYPVYLDSNIMAGRTGKYNETIGKYEGIEYLTCKEENQFIPSLPNKPVDMIYLCFPNNPTGTTIGKEELKKWVDYAKKHHSIILYDSAYEAYITQDDIAHSIYEIEGAREVAIEFRSFSKTAGFTGLRCAYLVIPKEVKGYTKDGKVMELNSLWNRRQCTKFNGVSYITQKAGEAIYTQQGQKQIRENIRYYMENAALIKQGLEQIGLKVYGGENAPYIWLKVPKQYTSWGFFDCLLEQVQIVGTPGVGFGPSGEGYFRLSAFGNREDTKEALERLKRIEII